MGVSVSTKHSLKFSLILDMLFHLGAFSEYCTTPKVMEYQTGCGETLRKGRKPPRRALHVPEPHPCLPKSHLGDFILLTPLPESVDAASFIPC